MLQLRHAYLLAAHVNVHAAIDVKNLHPVRQCCSCRVEQALPDLIRELLGPHGLQPSDCCYAVHTGGPKILERTAAALGVSADCMQVPPPYADDPESSPTLTATGISTIAL